MKIANKKNLYLLALLIICLLGVILVPTYAKFTSGFTTEEDAVGLVLSFNVNISNIEEYEELTIPAGGSEEFNVQITNSSGATAYYGIWYNMVNPSTLGSDIKIGKITGTEVSTSGSINNNASTTASIGIINNSKKDIKIRIGVASSATSTSDIQYKNENYLITGEVEILRDIRITSITIDGKISNSLPKGGTYTMTSDCTKGSTLTWNTYNKNITYTKGAQVGDKCSLNFTSSTNYPKLSSMPVGSYVAYVGSGGTVGNTAVACQTNGPASSSTATAETEASNSCSGQNARQDLDTSNYTYGYCYSAGYKYYTTGWRIAYIDNTDTNNPKAVIVSAGSPECNNRESIEGNSTYIKQANAQALKYCNSAYVDGNCTCTADATVEGGCSTPSTDAWAINDKDFYYMTKSISGYGKRLTSESSSLGDSGGALTELYCYNKYSYQECGYNNDLIDNGGYYWFAVQYSSTSTNGMNWYPNYRVVSNISDDYDYAFGLRPVISLSSSVYVTGGSGTMDDPYTIKKQ